MKRVVAACLGLVVVLTIAAAGCLFSPEPKTNEDPLPPGPPFPDTPDQLMANFKTAYTGLEIVPYRLALHPDYVFIFRPEDVPPGASGRLICAEELAVAENLFSGLPIERPGDTTIPAISAISIALLNRLGDWTDVGPDDQDFPNTRRGLYAIQLTFSRVDANTIIVNGQQEFYVVSRDSTVSGVTKPYFQLRGQRDLTNWLKTENDSWGVVKFLYSN